MFRLGAGIFLVFIAVFSPNPVSLRADLRTLPEINCVGFYPQNSIDALRLVRDCYVDKIDAKVLEDAFQKGGLAEVFKLLDPHSRYLDEQATAAEIKSEKEGKSFGGVGLEISLQGKNIVITGIIAGSPAFTADIKEGDIISAVCQGANTKGDCFAVDAMDLDIKDNKAKAAHLNGTVSRIRGNIGTAVTIKLKRTGTQNDVIVTLTRAIIKVENVTSKIFGEFGYVRLRHFSDTSAATQVSGEISKYPDIKGLVLDLRSNPGGYLPQANSISSLFLTRKQLIAKIVTRENPQERPEKYYPAFFQSIFGTSFRMPLVVLVDQGSASASEIVAAACQDNKRCVVLGMPTFGKALMQTRHDFGKERIYLTTGRIYRPNGKSLQGKGVIPDVIISNTDPGSIVDEMKDRDKGSERGLSGYLKGEEEEFTEEEKGRFALMAKDRQLAVALEILKILNMK